MPNYKPRYTSFEDIKILFPKVSQTSLTAAQANGIFISKAENEIDGRLAVKYSIPFSSGAVPGLIKSMAQDLSFYYIGRRFFTQTVKDKNPWIATYKEDVDELIKSILDGDTVIVDNSGSIIDTRTDQSQIWSNTTEYKPTFDHRDQTLQRIDPDRLEDEQDADDSRFTIVS